MRSLSEKEIDRILARGRMLSDRDITTMLDEFQKEQPEIYRAIYGEPSDAIAEDNPEMAGLYLELCFDIVWIYRKAFGKPPRPFGGEQWVLDSLTLLDAELKSLSDQIPMDQAFRSALQQRFLQRSIESGIQIELVRYLDREVQKYASFQRQRRCAIEITNSFLFVVVRLMDDLYSKKMS
jgi:hypothetical protein